MAGDLTAYQGVPILLGGANSTNPVADDAAMLANITALKGPITALSAEYVGESGGSWSGGGSLQHHCLGL